ncbi:hypothetical protein KEM56_001484 [Ascosphaera pollenicola]|nr:hypothetical protein KEM56_001484 [Ascosphaera pollenicola]
MSSKASSPSNGITTITTTTPFQESVYALLTQVPEGSVTTYGAIARALKTSPRAVGNALRNNPYAPRVPCHRCIASSGYINGFFGELVAKRSFRRDGDTSVKGAVTRSTKDRATRSSADAKASSARIEEATQVQRKIDMLKREGVHFDEKGMLKNRASVLYDGP